MNWVKDEDNRHCCPRPRKEAVNNIFPKLATNTENDNLIASTMRVDYQVPKDVVEIKFIGIRRARMQEALTKQMRAELEREQSQPAESAEVCTEYDGNFNGGGFVCKEPDLEEMAAAASEKHPLYDSEPMSYYRYKLSGKYGNNAGYPKGCTFVKDIRNPFKRSSQFTKPLDEQLEEQD